MDPDPWTAWTDPAALLRAGVALTPVAALDKLLRAAARRLAGRRVTVPGTGGELVLRWESLAFDPDPVGLALGQLGDLRLVASGVRWRDLQCHRAVLVCRNVHVRPFPVPVAVAAPVTLELAFAVEVLAGRLATAHPRLGLEPAGRDRAALRWARRPAWGSLTVSAEVGGDAVVVRPRALHLRGHRIPLPGWAPTHRIALPTLPRGLRLLGITADDGEIVLRLTADEWREEVPAARLDLLLARLT